MASRGHLGGLSWTTPQALRVLDAAGFDVVLVETVGVGQSEVEVAGLADTTLVLLAPGMGDGIQAAKAGILEIGDVYVVNKADRDGADQLRRELRGMVALVDRRAGGWVPPIVATVASRARGSRSWWQPWTRTGPGWSTAVSSPAPAPAGRPRRSRPSRGGAAGRWGGLRGRAGLDELAAGWRAGDARPLRRGRPAARGHRRLRRAARARLRGATCGCWYHCWCKVPMLCRCRLPTGALRPRTEPGDEQARPHRHRRVPRLLDVHRHQRLRRHRAGLGGWTVDMVGELFCKPIDVIEQR